MGESSPYLLSGPEENYDIPKDSFGKYLLNCLRKRDADDVLNVDAITGEKFTCGQLLEKSIKFTAVFKSLGLEKGDTVAIVSENVPNYFVPVLSALYMGVVVNPLNTNYLTGELKHGLLLSKPKLVICSERSLYTVLAVKEELDFVKSVVLMGVCSENHPNIANLDDLVRASETDIKTFTPLELDCVQDPACVFLSSGTTGLAKGVSVTHQNLRTVGYIYHPDYCNIQPGDVTVLVMPFFHIFGFVVNLSAIAFSLKVVLIDKFKPDTFLQSIQDHKVTKLFMVPPLVVFLAKSPLVDSYDLSSVGDILCGAAPLGKAIEDEVRKRLRTVNIRQMYGLTETTGLCTFQTGKVNPGNVGILVPGMCAKIYNSKTLEAVGPFEVGELCFKGPAIMKGYVGNAAETENSFDSDGFFHTGDIGYYDNDKCFYIVDRLKELIKYKGFQVPPAELEALILTHPMVRDCGVIGIPDDRAGQVPLAFVAKQNGATLVEQDVIDFVASRISIEKRLYGGVVFIEEIPKTSSGKILRRKLVEISEKIPQRNTKSNII